MKTFLFLILSIVIAGSGVAQIEQKKAISVECFSPIMTPSMKQYFNDEWSLTPSTNYSRKYFSLGFSAAYAIKSDQLGFGFRTGFVIRKVQESNLFDYYSGNRYYVDEKYTYRQYHLTNVFFLFREEQLGKITVRLSLEVPFILYGIGKSDYYNRTYSIDTITGGLATEYIIQDNQGISSGFGAGLGLNLGAFYSLSTNLSVGVDLGNYILYTSFTKPTNIHRNEYYSPSTGGTSFDIRYEASNKYTQWGFSRLSPKAIIKYSF